MSRSKRREGSTLAAVPYVVLGSQGYINLSAYTTLPTRAPMRQDKRIAMPGAPP
jgi:hypothetical protein